MVSFVNITPYSLSVRRVDETFLEVPPSGTVARVAISLEDVAEMDGVAITSTTFGEVHGLPEPKEGLFFIGLPLVAQAAVRAGRSDVLAPGRPILDEEGRPVGYKGLSLPTA